MSRYLFCLSILCFVGLSSAQSQVKLDKLIPAGNGVMLGGQVVDSATQEPLPYVSVGLHKQGETDMDGVSADSLGKFDFKNLEPATYVLTIFYVGYPKMEHTVLVDGKSNYLNLGVINMRSSATTLAEVEIVDFRQLIEQRPDGHVYNAEKDITNKGTSSESLLRKVPMVTVDLEGNVQLRGNGNVRVLIDGKPSTMVAASV